jgi:N-acetylmuramic acid 6-phosphate etherase
VRNRPLTERPHPRWRNLDQKSTIELLRLLNREDRRVPFAVARAIPSIARAVDAIVAALSHGGRLVYAGAGTSGRLGALDAAECRPTFGLTDKQVLALMAGGRRAFDHAVEGAEDSTRSGAREIARVGAGPKDVVVGIAASGTTPYVGGALTESRRRRAKTILVTTNRRPPLARLADITIVADVGHEVLAGSTRMKSGTAQKLVLNMLTTAAMARLGRVYDNRMIYVALNNVKLRTRALEMLADLSGVPESEAARALRRAGSVPVALIMLKAGVGRTEAHRLLSHAGGNVRKAIAIVSAESPARGEKSPAQARRERKKHLG